MASLHSMSKLSERDLHLLWQKASYLEGALRTQRGEALKVLYPGRSCQARGPDFRDAALLTQEGRVIRGDIELHLKASDWKAHGHHRDPSYNGVVLHVTFRPQGRETLPLQSKMDVPVVALTLAVERIEDSFQGGGLWSELGSLSDGPLGDILDKAGDQRFMARSRGFSMEIESEGADQALYMGLMDTLGYGGNRKPFQTLARRAPFSIFVPLSNEPSGTRLLAIQALLLKAGGLLDSFEQRRRLEIQALLKHLSGLETVPPVRWPPFKGRPQNHPVKRIVGMSYLMDQYLKTGLARGLANLLSSGKGAALIKGLMVPPFIGKGRALEMAVNAVLPFLHAVAEKSQDTPLKKLCLEAYTGLPKTPSNQITREMEKLISIQKRPGLANTARRQQGLIYLYKMDPQLSSIQDQVPA